MKNEANSNERTPAAGNQWMMREKEDVRACACLMDTSQDLRNHSDLHLTVRFESSGATAKTHGWIYISMDGTKHTKRRKMVRTKKKSD